MYNKEERRRSEEENSNRSYELVEPLEIWGD